MGPEKILEMFLREVISSLFHESKIDIQIPSLIRTTSNEQADEALNTNVIKNVKNKMEDKKNEIKNLEMMINQIPQKIQIAKRSNNREQIERFKADLSTTEMLLDKAKNELAKLKFQLSDAERIKAQIDVKKAARGPQAISLPSTKIK